MKRRRQFAQVAQVFVVLGVVWAQVGPTASVSGQLVGGFCAGNCGGNTTTDCTKVAGCAGNTQTHDCTAGTSGQCSSASVTCTNVNKCPDDAHATTLVPRLTTTCDREAAHAQRLAASALQIRPNVVDSLAVVWV